MLKGPRLTLIPMTRALIAAELQGSSALAEALQTEPPASWPPELYERDDLERVRRLLDDPVNAGWTVCYLVERGPPPMLVGVAGYAGAPDAAGVVELGYSILPQHRRRGLATEAVGALIEHAFAQPEVQVVAAETYPALEASIGVLMKSGFRPVPSRAGSETLRYELPRPASISRHKLEATYYRTALLLGLVGGDAVHRWAEDIIEREADPPHTLLELVLVSPADLSALRHALWPLVDEPDPRPVLDRILGLVHADLESGRRSLGDTVTVLRQMRSMLRLPADLYADLNVTLVTHGSIGVPESPVPAWLRRFAESRLKS